MSNTILTPTAVTREALRVLHQKLTFVGSINRGYDASFAQEGAKIGTDLKIRLPNQYVVTDGAALTTQDTTESSVTLQVTSQKHVGMNFTSAELTLSLDDFSKRIIEPAMAVLAASVEADALSMRKDVYQQADNTAAAITFANVLAGRRKLNDALAPANDRTALLNSSDSASLVDALKGLFQDSGQLSSQYREGHMGYAAGFNFMETSHLSTQTRGAGDASYVVNTSTGITSGSGTIAVTAGTGALKQGEIITIAGVNRVHPETKVDTGVLQQFVITADYAGGAGNITVSPVPVTSGATQNVVINSAGASKAVVISGTASTNYGQSMVYQKDAFTFATADIVMPKGVDFGAREQYDGISLRLVRDYDINNDRLPCRVDILYGYKSIRPQLACRLANVAG
jgi:hypothetical protein